MKRNWIGDVAAATLLVAGAASAQTMGNGPAPTTPPGAATTVNPVNPGRTATGTVGTDTAMTPAPGTVDNGPATTSGNGSMVNGGVGNSNGAINTSTQSQPQPAHGANSFTQGEAKDRLQAHGFQNVTNLHKDADGLWRGEAAHNGQHVSVWLDYKGNIGQGGPGPNVGQQATQ